jgi:raffinose/stachyose/melibiose transport system substrate-binding protein
MKRRIIAMLACLLVVSLFASACGGGNAGNGGSGNAANGGGNNGGNAKTGGNSGGSGGNGGGGNDGGGQQVEPFTITLRHIQVGDAQKFRLAILKDAVARTEAEVPGLKIELDGVEDEVNRYTKLPAEMAAGTQPTIFDLFGGMGDAQKYAKAGRLLDLTPILAELGLSDKFLNLSDFMVDGKVYGLPIGGNNEGFFYNKKIFDQYGLKVPKTMEELDAVAETLKANGVTPIAMGSQAGWVPNMIVNTLIGRYAGPDFVAKFADGSLKWDSPEVIRAYAKYEEWVNKGYFSKGELGMSYDQQLNEFLTGKAGMLFDGSWRSSAFRNDDLTKDVTPEDIGYFPMPAAADGIGDQTYVNGNMANGYGFSANANENELKAIKAFIKHMYNDEMQIRGLLEDGVLPSMKISDESALSKVDDPVVLQVLDVAEKAGGAFSHYETVIPSKVYQETEVQIQAIIAGKATAEQAAKAIQKVMDEESGQ